MNKTQSGAINGWIVFGVVVLLVVIGVVFLQMDRTDEIVNESNEVETSQQGEDEEETNEQEIQLIAVGNYTGNGTATREFEEGQFTHSVFANIGDPAPGKFYEGWLVGPSVVSTGKLEKVDDVYVLSFTSEEDLTGHAQVVITEETEANGLDGVPEAHVLEGSFN